MSQIFGEFIENFPVGRDALELTFYSSHKPIKEKWRNHRLSAYFIADYFANLIPIDRDPDRLEERLNNLKAAVSYIGNELLENAMKFHERSNNFPVKLGINFLEELEQITAVIFTQNSIKYKSVYKFQTFIENLLSADPNELYIQQIEKAAEDEHGEASGLGLLTTINDYSAKLGWKFEPEPRDAVIVTVTTMAQIVV
ncbi:hypothetical protein BCD67_14515 [Oscillatoriales cyanobacterium USR001]|nr:hypothetical protein BCD67_14515 [Oscillatoriales cyanobacterium USR001]